MSKSDEDYLDNLLKTMGKTDDSAPKGQSAIEKLGSASSEKMTDPMYEKGGQRETETGTNDMLGEQNLDT